MQDSQDNQRRGGEGRKEGRKARRYRRGGGNPAGFNHRPTRRRGSPSAFYPFTPLPPHSEEVSKLLSSAGLSRDGWRGRGGRDPGGWRGVQATGGAMRIGLISNSQTRRNRYISRRLLSIGAPAQLPRDIYPRQAGARDGHGGGMRSYVDERARTRGHLVLEPLQKRSILDSQRFITSSNMAPIPSPSSCPPGALETPFSRSPRPFSQLAEPPFRASPRSRRYASP